MCGKLLARKFFRPKNVLYICIGFCEKIMSSFTVFINPNFFIQDDYYKRIARDLEMVA